jgi:hypothetical protein
MSKPCLTCTSYVFKHSCVCLCVCVCVYTFYAQHLWFDHKHEGRYFVHKLVHIDDRQRIQARPGDVVLDCLLPIILIHMRVCRQGSVGNKSCRRGGRRRRPCCKVGCTAVIASCGILYWLFTSLVLARTHKSTVRKAP